MTEGNTTQYNRQVRTFRSLILLILSDSQIRPRCLKVKVFGKHVISTFSPFLSFLWVPLVGHKWGGTCAFVNIWFFLQLLPIRFFWGGSYSVLVCKYIFGIY